MLIEPAYGFPEDANELVRALSAHLARLKGDGAMPLASAILPERLPKGVLPNVILADVEGDTGPGCAGPWRIRFRLLGENIRAATGEPWAGRYLDRDLVGELLPIFLAAYETPLRTRRPSVAPHQFVNFRDNVTYRSHRYLFPLSGDGQTISRLIGFQPIETGAWRSGV
ncbi:MAG: hypothetical protein KIT20_09015 [Alphaproteobacteria bacterium]|nr:hypothetical protein [Alphaproteobacteria bacterium]